MALQVTAAPYPGTITSVGNANGTQSVNLLPQPAAPKPAPQQSSYDPFAAAGRAADAAAEVQSPIPNIDSIVNNAKAAAGSSSNDYYNKSINAFVQQQALQQQTAKEAQDFAVKNAQDLLKQTQEANTLAGQRTTEDTATKEAQAAQAADWRQTDQGGQYDMDRVAQAITQAKSGLTGSGIAGGQSLSSQEKFNTQESQQATQDAQQKQATELAKARNFEDLATSNTLATGKEAQTEKGAQIDFDSFIRQQSMELLKQQQSTRQQADQIAAQVQAAQIKQGYLNFYKTISNPAQKIAYAKAYGSFLS